ncbi:hypothetical protein C7I36_00590 [Zobellella taiwanensis]|uniref:Methyltransferase FkbM domain-containing protein n=1 Tax=Zobellella taiwanensis TaxID=347535 RepID=A0A2P7RDQ5_9GAMM|nr:hypothetical protein [Zobellella taiwanensis]PSJ48355.1 hypothetical protein C7I36_00590 [Zobellella taiwanensis]
MTSTSTHTLVHIGAGNGSQLLQHQAMQPARWVLIEPVPTHANSLRQKYPSAEVWELAISCQHNNQPANLTEFNLSEASSLHQPSGLLQLYPGIKAVRQHQVQTQTPATMMARLQLPEGEQHKLVIEANGEETAIIEALTQAGLLQQFKQVQLALPATPLYIHEQHTEQLPQLLQSCHFELTKENTDDPDIHVQLWQFNQHSYQLAQQRETLLAQIQEQAQQITQLTTQLQQEQTKHTAASRHADSLKSQLAELKTKNAESGQQLVDLQQKLNEQSRQSQQLAEQRETLLARQNEHKRQIAELNTQLEQEQNKHAAASRHAETLNSQQAELNARMVTTEQALADTQTQLATSEEELTKYKSYFQNRKKQHEAAEQQIAELTQQLSSANEQINQLTTQLQQQQQAGSKLSELEQKMEQLFASQAEQLRQNTNALGQHVTKMHASSNRQWQAALAVQHSLSFGEQPLQFSDTSISPELAQHLITLVQNNNYDLIIEFGSGHSTSLLARALLGQHKRWQGNGQLALKNNEPQTQLVPSEHDLPKRVISFEHNKNYHQQTQHSLQQQGLSEVVELVYAPLVNCTFSPEQLFYDCEPKLQQLASLLQNEEKHILVLVDGPSAEPTAHSRTPALPALLNHFARHRLDVVLDDHHRDSEQQSAEQWRSQLAERSLSFKEHIWTGDKSALLLSINP